ncbi:hypothetical protein KEM48_011987 [Puccinia striiformis f. sp. tritici PST-130]|nr:hypothetical protein KEM48_011987 [Puccinia striiformis f. sp. tritici PST-130]
MQADEIDLLIPPSTTPSFTGSDSTSGSIGNGQEAKVFVHFTAYVPRAPKEGQKGPIQQAPLHFKHPKDCPISFNTRGTTLEELQHMVVDIMNGQCSNLGEAAVRQALQDITQEHSDANQEGSAQRSSEAPKDSFPTYRNPITPQEGIILTGSAATIWAEAIIHRAPGVNVNHPPSTLTYRNLKKRKNNSPPSPAPQPDPHCTSTSTFVSIHSRFTLRNSKRFVLTSLSTTIINLVMIWLETPSSRESDKNENVEFDAE